MSKVKTSVHESKSVVKSVSLSNGGFVEIELDEANSGYLKVQVGSCNSGFVNSMGAWRWVQHGNDKKNIKTLTEIRDAANSILETL